MGALKYLIVVLPSLILIILGISIKYFKAYWLISGYNTMSKEKKKNVDVERLGPFMGNFCFVLAAYMFFIILFLMLELVALSIVFVVLLVLTIIFLLIKAQKYDGNAVKADGTMKRSTKIVIGIIIAFFVIIFSGVGVLLFQSNLPTEFVVLSDSLKINGAYGETIKGEDIVSVILSSNPPDITLRTNGSALGNRLKGYFNVTGAGNVKLFLNTDTKSYIFIRTGKQIFIINSEDIEQTRDLYEKISALK